MTATVPTADEFNDLVKHHLELAQSHADLKKEVTALNERVVKLETPPPKPVFDPIGKRVGGMNIGAKNYDDPEYQKALAKFNLVILGIYQGWRGDVGGNKMAEVVKALKLLNPEIKVGNYTCLNEVRNELDPKVSASADVARKLHDANWWLKNAAGEMLRYTAQYAAFDTDFTMWSPADASSQRLPQWLADRNQRVLFGSAGFDVAYSDNAMRKYRGPPANWKRDGVDRPNDEPAVVAAWQQGQAAYWAALGQATGLPVMGNPDNDLSSPAYTKRLQGAFFEGAMGKSYSMKTWAEVWARYTGMMKNVLDAKWVMFNITADLTDQRLRMFGLCTALLGDGMFVLTDAAVDYSSAPWFDEYNIRLGKPVAPIPTMALANSVWGRPYEGGQVLVNTSATQTFSTSMFQHGYHHPDGSPVGIITMPPSTGLILLRN